MKQLFVVACLAAFAASAHAQYKCMGASGKVAFQQTPCPQGTKQDKLVVRDQEAAPSASGGASGAGQPSGSVEQRMLVKYERDRRIRELEQGIAQTQDTINRRNSAMDSELDALRRKKLGANNNLAGATWEQSISTEMQAVAQKHRAMHDVDAMKLKQLHEDLARARSAQ